MRRISTGVQGRSILGDLFVEDQTIKPNTGDDIFIQEFGSPGRVLVGTELLIRDGQPLTFSAPAVQGFVELQAPNSTDGFETVSLTLPTNSGNAGDVLTTDGSGNLTFSDLTIEVSNQTADTATYYPLLSTSNSGSISSVDTSSSKLSFQPSSGTLTVTDLSVTDISATDGTFSNDLTVTNSLSAGSITETSSISLKTDITNIENSIDIIGKLRPVSYTRKSTGIKEIGLIAEEVEKIIPEVITNNGEYKAISYSRLTALLINAVANLQQEIDRLKA